MSAATNGHKVTQGAEELVDWASHQSLVSRVIAGEIRGMKPSGHNKLRIVVEIGKLVVHVKSAGCVQQIILLTQSTERLCKAIWRRFGNRKDWKVELAEG